MVTVVCSYYVRSSFCNSVSLKLKYTKISSYFDWLTVGLNFATDTSRPKRDHEVDGQEYRFMSSRDQRDCDVQDAGLVNDHFSGTNIEAVRNIAEMVRLQLCVLHYYWFTVFS